MSTPNEKHDTQIIEPDTKGDTAKAEIFLADAQAGNDSEVKMGLFAALKLYPKASAWSIAISLAVVMEGMSPSQVTLMAGFDIILINNFYAYPAFRNRFGVEQPNGTFQIPAAWQAGLGNGAAVGQFCGLLVHHF